MTSCQTELPGTHRSPRVAAMKPQAPKGTRDFYPRQMAARNFILDAWRRVSIRNGFEQVDGPIFESLDLYKIKSGEGIVGELFHFEDRGGRELALRPEFTPTLARMVAAQAHALPKPIKWFSTPNLCRAERPQRGRLREFFQWNVDILGCEGPIADAECIFAAVDLMRELGLGPQHVRVKISHRDTVRHILLKMGVASERVIDAFNLLDRRDRIDPAKFTEAAAELGLSADRVARLDQTCRLTYPVGRLSGLVEQIGSDESLGELRALDGQLRAFGIADWCEYDLGVVRGLAYYTGAVFEVHEISGAERAMAGGGRYDKLIELFGGPSLPGVGLGMGDVVLMNVLDDKGLLPEDLSPKPDAFVLAVTDVGAGRAPAVAAQLRAGGLHARLSYKTTRNVGKLMKDAAACGARWAVILDDQAGKVVAVKDMASGEQVEVAVSGLADHLRGGSA